MLQLPSIFKPKTRVETRDDGEVKIEWFRAARRKTAAALHFIYGPTGNASLDSDKWDIWGKCKLGKSQEKLRSLDFLLQEEKIDNFSGRTRHLVAVHISCPVPSLALFSRAIEPFEERSIKSNKVFQQPANPLAATLQAPPFLKSVRRRLRASKTKSWAVWFANRSSRNRA